MLEIFATPQNILIHPQTKSRHIYLGATRKPNPSSIGTDFILQTFCKGWPFPTGTIEFESGCSTTNTFIKEA
jgi:hypothetical protein